MNRRLFTTGAVLGALGLAACSGRPPMREGSVAVTDRSLESFGLQLSTVTPFLLKDFEGTLGRVSEIGYTQVEFSALGFLGRPVSRVKTLLDQSGLSAPVGRISPRLPDGFNALDRRAQMAAFRERAGPDYLLDNVRYGLDAAAALDQRHLILPALMPEHFTSLDRFKVSVELLARAGELCRTSGVRFGYHNHDWEFKPLDGVVPFDLMLERIDPELMSAQLDVYWVTKAGGDPLHYFRSYPGRIPSCHLKDIDAEGDFADVGSGIIDFPAIARAALASGTEFFFVERDNPPQPMQTAQNGFAYLKTMRF